MKQAQLQQLREEKEKKEKNLQTLKEELETKKKEVHVFTFLYLWRHSPGLTLTLYKEGEHAEFKVQPAPKRNMLQLRLLNYNFIMLVM